MIKLDTLMAVCGKHPAHRISFDVLYDKLNELCSERTVVLTPTTSDDVDPEELEFVRIKPHVIKRADETGDLEIYNYSRQCVYDGAWNVFTCAARGLVINKKTREILATPFPKFFNFGEGDCDWIPNNEKISVYEKMDGCLGIVFHDGSTWRICSRGSFDSFAQKAGKELLEKYDIDNSLVPGTTYMFEILSEETRIVIPYEKQALVLLGAYDGRGYSVSDEDLDFVAFVAGFDRPQAKEFSNVQQVIEYTKPLDYKQEGFIVSFEGGHRFKIKSDGYVEKHKLMYNFSPLAVWDVFTNGGGQDYRAELPEEIWPEFDKIWANLESRYDRCYRDIVEDHERTQSLSDKELGLHFSELVEKEASKKFLWNYRKGSLLKDLYTPDSRIRRSFCELFRPKGNQITSEILEDESEQ